MPLYSRTTVERGIPTVKLFTRGEKRLLEAIDVLDEIMANNKGHEQYTKPAAAAIESIKVTMDRIARPVHTTQQSDEGDTGEAKGNPADAA